MSICVACDMAFDMKLLMLPKPYLKLPSTEDAAVQWRMYNVKERCHDQGLPDGQPCRPSYWIYHHFSLEVSSQRATLHVQEPLIWHPSHAKYLLWDLMHFSMAHTGASKKSFDCEMVMTDQGCDDTSIPIIFHGIFFFTRSRPNSLVLHKPAVCKISLAIAWKINV